MAEKKEKKKQKKRTGTPQNKLTVAKVKKRLPDSLGSINWLAGEMGVSWHTMDNFIKKSKVLVKIYEETVNKCMMKAKDNVYNSIMLGDMKTTRWYLSKMAPEYRDKLEIDGDFDINITIKGADDDELEKL